MSNFQRVWVEKKKEFQTEAISLLNTCKQYLHIEHITQVQIWHIYDLFHVPNDMLPPIIRHILSDEVTDTTHINILPPIQSKYIICTEFLPGQYDQRADSAEQCIQLMFPSLQPIVKTAKYITLEGDLSLADIQKIKTFLINPVESREKDITIQPSLSSSIQEELPPIYPITSMLPQALEESRKQLGLSISTADFLAIQQYFIKEKREPNTLELKALDTYWSDHCRHTTFLTHITDIQLPTHSYVKQAWKELLSIKDQIGRKDKPITLMEMATLFARYAKQKGLVQDWEISNEINACSIMVQIDHEPWLMQFKNETHNHPTEIEPFGGAATCLGGAIRDPLSGRSFVYQAIRVSGAGDITEPIEQTLPHKLPQKMISTLALDGFSSYGNQIGLATTHVREIYHNGYKAKRMEVGCVVGAVPLSHIKREEPIAGDIVILLGGRTGKDGIGGASGSSKQHTSQSLQTAGAEVQKGNPIIERKIQRLFKKKHVTQLIKKCNDFGAGGIAVAVGELSDGIDVYLHKVPLKYTSLTPLEIALSESQERMAVVVSQQDVPLFISLANEENIEATAIADIASHNRLVFWWKNKKIFDIDRSFINTNGAIQSIQIDATQPIPLPFTSLSSSLQIKDKLLNHLKDKNIACRKGMVNIFDSTIGGTTILMPYGGKYQLTETQCSVQKFPIDKFCTQCSMVSYGFQPTIGTCSPFHGGAYAVVESIAKIVANGGNWQGIRFSFQEYFEKLDQNPQKWSKPFLALLGAFQAQVAFQLPAIGGKDSMSGSFEHLSVPPTLISFAFQTANISHIISPEWKQPGSYLYLIHHTPKQDQTPHYEQIKNNFSFIHEYIKKGIILSAFAIEYGGIAEAIIKMSLGNKIGASIRTSEDIFAMKIGSILIESKEEINFTQAIYIGQTNNKNNLSIQDTIFSFDELIEAYTETFRHIFPIHAPHSQPITTVPIHVTNTWIRPENRVDTVQAFVPIFPGTNCEFDTIRQLNIAGASTSSFVFKNQSPSDIHASIQQLSTYIKTAHIIVFPGGFSAGDEPDGSGKFIATIIQNKEIAESIMLFLQKGGLILGICNGFQALVKSGLLPHGYILPHREKTATLFKNTIGKHISCIVYTKIISNLSPWVQHIPLSTVFALPISHGEGRYMDTEQNISQLTQQGQLITQYCTIDGEVNSQSNINGSTLAIEGICSPNGQIFGKMGHSERVTNGCLQNIYGNIDIPIFVNGVRYWKG